MTDSIPEPAASSQPPTDATANAGVAERDTLCFHTSEPAPAPADQSVRPGGWPFIEPERLEAIRKRLVETAARLSKDGSTTGFRKWKKARKDIRDVDAMLAAYAAPAKKAQPQ